MKKGFKGSKRQLVWTHNGFLGSVAMARKGMNAILNSSTATDASKDLAYGIALRLDELYKSLKERVDEQ